MLSCSPRPAGGPLKMGAEPALRYKGSASSASRGLLGSVPRCAQGLHSHPCGQTVRPGGSNIDFRFRRPTLGSNRARGWVPRVPDPSARGPLVRRGGQVLRIPQRDGRVDQVAARQDQLADQKSAECLQPTVCPSGGTRQGLEPARVSAQPAVDAVEHEENLWRSDRRRIPASS
jgi:hypothetical protein